jgi:hypothetical protein
MLNNPNATVGVAEGNINGLIGAIRIDDENLSGPPDD